VFDPASSAALPNVVDPEDLPTANALSVAWGPMPAVGGPGAHRYRVRRDTAPWSTQCPSRTRRVVVGRTQAVLAARDEHDAHVVEATRETIHYARRRAILGACQRRSPGAAAGVLR
jgi:hypothetical protein